MFFMAVTTDRAGAQKGATLKEYLRNSLRAKQETKAGNDDLFPACMP
jgi:hypothetical protein